MIKSIRQPSFESHCRRVWNSRFFQRLGTLYWRRWPRGPWRAARGEVVLDSRWQVTGPSAPGAFLQNAVEQFRVFRQVGFGIAPRTGRSDRFVHLSLGKGPSHPEGFICDIRPDRIEITGRTENGLAQGLFHLERMMEQRGAPLLVAGRHTLAPRFDLRLHCDVWGGYTVTPRWMDVPRRRETFLLMARHGINATQIRLELAEVFHDPRYPEISNPRWCAHLAHLRKIVRQAGECGLRIFIHADNFCLPLDHSLFKRRPSLKGAPIFKGDVCPVCTGSREGMELVADGWGRVFAEVPELGGIIAIVGGECFTHCAMRPVRDANGRNPCPRCGSRSAADVAGDLIVAVARRIRRVAPRAHVLAWPYSAEVSFAWRANRAEMELFIRRVAHDAVYVLEIEKEGIQRVRGEQGVYRAIGDYSSSYVGPSLRFRHQSEVASREGVRLCVKTETLQGWEGGALPYLPVMEHWCRRWKLLRKTPARDVFMGWPVFGFNDAPPMELAAWQLWKGGPPADRVLDRMIRRDFGERATPGIRRAYRLLGEALEMLPRHWTAYYAWIHFLGPANPLLLDANEKLDDAFLGFYFYEGEGIDSSEAEKIRRFRLPYWDNLIHPLLCPPGQDPSAVTARCVRRAQAAWEKALALYEKSGAQGLHPTTPHFVAERRILRHFGHLLWTWVHAEEFYIARRRLASINRNCYSQLEFQSERKRVLRRMLAIARAELGNSRAAWSNMQGDERLDVSLRLDTPTVPMEQLYRAKFNHTRKVIAILKNEHRRKL